MHRGRDRVCARVGEGALTASLACTQLDRDPLVAVERRTVAKRPLVGRTVVVRRRGGAKIMLTGAGPTLRRERAVLTNRPFDSLRERGAERIHPADDRKR